MRGTLFFEIPDDDQEIMVKLVEAIPSNWSWVDGDLHAPEMLIVSGQVEEHTGFAVRRFHRNNPTIVGSYNQDERKQRNPDLFAIMVDQKLPGFIFFDEAGYETPITFKLTKHIVVGFLQKGYRGGLRFFKDCYGNSKFDNPARCDIAFKPWHGGSASYEEGGPQPARIKIEWDSRYNGREEDVTPIIAVCRSFDLREYALAEPVEAAAS